MLVRCQDRQFVAWEPGQGIPGRASRFHSSGTSLWVAWKGPEEQGLLSLESNEPVVWRPDIVDFAVRDVATDSDGGLWLGGRELLHIPAVGAREHQIAVFSLFVDGDRLRLAHRAGVLAVQDDELVHISEQLPLYFVTTDPEGTVWAQGYPIIPRPG